MATVPFTNQYSEDLFGCFDDINTCVYGFCCTPCLVGQSAEDANVGKCFDTACCLVAWNCIPYVGGCISACKTAEIMNKVSAKFALPHIYRPCLACLTKCLWKISNWTPHRWLLSLHKNNSLRKLTEWPNPSNVVQPSCFAVHVQLVVFRERSTSVRRLECSLWSLSWWCQHPNKCNRLPRKNKSILFSAKQAIIVRFTDMFRNFQTVLR
jgi:Cys-rich protein (TIGR01571 family)